MKNKTRIYGYILYIVLFCAVLLIPLLGINTAQGKSSETEMRVLKSFPQLFDEEGVADNLKENFEAWLDDNIGLRDKFVEITANIKLKLFHQTTSSDIEIGRDGWYFYTPNHNVTLATGEYVIPEETLERIAEAQQRVSDWEKRKGIPFLLALTPAKTTIYPEYIASGDYGVRDTTCDLVEAYLKAHTDVPVVNVKTAILDGKAEHQMFRRMDTHWTEAGAYVAYQAIAAELEKMGFQMVPIEVEYGETAMDGEFSRMLGCRGVLGEEVVPTISWETHATAVTEGELYDSLLTIPADAASNPQRFYLYENPDAPNGTLLIYGDSQWEPVRKLPALFGESFRTVLVMRFNKRANVALEALVDPDVVVVPYGERLQERLVDYGDAPEALQLPELPYEEAPTSKDYGAWIGNRGIWLDRCNGVFPENNEIVLDPGAETVQLVGWAADFKANKPLQALYAQVGDILLECEYGIERTGMAENLDNDDLLNIGFQASFPASYFQNGAVEEISFIGVSADGKCLYTPVTYPVTIK